MRLLEAPTETRQQSSNLHGIRGITGRIGLSLALLAGPTLANEALEESSAFASASNPVATVGMPFSGKWAWDGALIQPDANGNYNDNTSSHPSVHHRFGGDWATDLYDPAGTTVKLHATSSDGPVTFTYNRSYDSCASAGANIAGHGIVLNVLVSGNSVGTIDYGHLDNLAASGTNFADGTTVGTITSEPFDTAGGCYTARHTHIELKNSSNYACWADNGNPGVSLSEGTAIGQLGSGNTGPQQKCAADATPSGGNVREPSAIVDPASGRNVFFVGADNYIHQWSVIGGHWSDVKLLDGSSAEGVAPGSSPSAVEDSATGRNAFYVGADNALWQWSVQNGAWHNNRLGGNVRAGTSPSAIVDPASGRNVFFVDANGTIDQLSVQNNQWLVVPIGGIALAGTSPSALEDTTTGRNIFYVGLDNRISQLSVMSNQWTNVELNDSAGNQTLAAGSSPNVVFDPNSGRNIFYVGADNRLWQYSVQNGAWHNNQLIDSAGNQLAASGTSPNAVYDSASGRNIFYTGTDKQIWQYSVQNNSWHNFKLTGVGGNPAVDAGTSPGATVDSSSGRNIFYYSNGLVYQWSVQNNTWTNFKLQP